MKMLDNMALLDIEPLCHNVLHKVTRKKCAFLIYCHKTMKECQWRSQPGMGKGQRASDRKLGETIDDVAK